MIESTLLLTFLFAVWGPDGGTHAVYQTDDLETDCDHMHANGCTIVDGDGRLAIVVEDPFRESIKGCNTLTHEWFHIMGYAEHEIPACGMPSQEFRK